MALLKKNNKAYDSADVTIAMLNTVAEEVTEIEYGHETEHQRNYSLGTREPTSWSMGNTEYNGESITMRMSEVIKIENAIGGDKRLDRVKPFDIVIVYRNEFAQIVTDIVRAKFKGQGRTVNGDMGLSRQIPLFILGIQYNVNATSV